MRERQTDRHRQTGRQTDRGRQTERQKRGGGVDGEGLNREETDK